MYTLIAIARFHKASAGRNLFTLSVHTLESRIFPAHIWIRKPCNWHRCEAFPARTPDCDINVATLHRVFLPEQWGSVYFSSWKRLEVRDEV